MVPTLVRWGCPHHIVVRWGYLVKWVHLAGDFISFQDYLGRVAVENLFGIWTTGKALIWGPVSRACPCQSPGHRGDIWILCHRRLSIELDIIFEDVVELSVQGVYLLVLWGYSNTDGSLRDHRGVFSKSPRLFLPQSFLLQLRFMHFNINKIKW